ncbi:hypothetical protein HRI_003397200 [Hibiscus trionum]|uniref:Late embryogenesis abundant protein LEA-2 subgroup domain-containing protein n=1 Tax=Hibiscus trionum TaxID=183268 RepID=A0A9W7MGL1_HIBTR|nr:hypothetical protein HRI_003397200 [Hibiscus trionum]
MAALRHHLPLPPALPTRTLIPTHTLTTLRLNTDARPCSVAFSSPWPSFYSSSASYSSYSGSFSAPTSPTSRFNPSHCPISTPRTSASWNAEFRVSNPNKKLSINYGDVISSVFHGDHYLAETRIGPFSQGTGDVRTLDASYSVVDSFVYGRVVDAMNGERRCGQVRFNVKAVADMAFRYGGWRGRWRLLRVWSDDITLTGSPGKMIGGSKRCTVG